MAGTGSSGVDPELLWAPAERPRRGRPPAHSRAAITAEAVAIADAEGLAAVTMRRVAGAIGVGAMTLYTYVPNKETLLELMIDQVNSPAALPGLTGDWRADLRGLARAQVATMRRHPWLLAALPDRQTLGPNSLAHLEHALGALAPTGLSAQSKLETFALITGFLASYVSYELAQQRAGRTTEEAAAAQGRYLVSVVAGGAYPRLAEALAQPSAAQGDTFERLLDRIIDGLVTAG